MKLVNKLIDSFNNGPDGFSARKLTAFAFMVCIGYIHWKFIDSSNAIEALCIDLIGAAFFLGLITASQLIALRGGTEDKTKDNGTTD